MHLPNLEHPRDAESCLEAGLAVGGIYSPLPSGLHFVCSLGLLEIIL